MNQHFEIQKSINKNNEEEALDGILPFISSLRHVLNIELLIGQINALNSRQSH